MYKLCVFDMDGTFVNSLGDIAAAMNRSLEKLGHKPYAEEDYCRMVGDGMRVLCKRAIPDAGDEELERLISYYNADYLNNCCIKTAPYDGMVELAEELRRLDIKRAILSNKPHTQACEIAEKLFDSELFTEIIGQSERFPTKPAPDALLYLIEKYSVSKEETVYIGDSDVDIKLGKAAGVFTVGVTWGFRGEAELKAAGADALAKTADELKALLIK